MIKIFLLILLLTTISFAQHDSSLINFILDESILIDELDEINFYYQNKVNISTASYLQLLSLPFTNKEIVKDILILRENNELNSIEDITKIKHLSNYDLYILQNLVDFRKNDSEGSIKINYDNYNNANKIKNYIRYNSNNNLNFSFFNSNSKTRNDFNGTIGYQNKIFIGDFLISDLGINHNNSLKTNYDLQIKPVYSNRKDYYRGFAYNDIFGNFGAKLFISKLNDYLCGAELTYDYFSVHMQNLGTKNEYYILADVPFENISTGLKFGLTSEKYLYKLLSLSAYFPSITSNITFIDYEVMQYSKILVNYNDLQLSYFGIKDSDKNEHTLKVKNIFSLKPFFIIIPSIIYKSGNNNSKKFSTNVAFKYYDGEFSLLTKGGINKNGSKLSYKLWQSVNILLFNNWNFEVGAFYNESIEEEKYFTNSINEIIMYNQVTAAVIYFCNISYNMKNIKIDLSMSKNKLLEKLNFNTIFYF